MKRLSLLLTLAAIVFISSCSESEDPEAAYDFKEQVAQGQIEGDAWTFSAGKAFLTEDQEGNIIYSVNMYSDQETAGTSDVCRLFGADFDEIFFSIPTEVGVYELSFDLNSSSSRTATLFDRENTLNVIVSDGAIEIIAVTETQVTGRMDIKSGSDNFINGNFTLDICGN
jgi:hypothetical protein